MPASDARCQQMDYWSPQATGTTLSNPVPKKPQINTKKQKKPQGTAGLGGSFWLLCLALTCAWPLPVQPGVPAHGPVLLRAGASGEGWGGE